jgi:hypothetical protein
MALKVRPKAKFVAALRKKEIAKIMAGPRSLLADAR